MPIFEAMTNSLYAIQERFPDDWPGEGVITVEILRAQPARDEKPDAHLQVTGFVITDNGLGLNDKLFSHFLELDTEYRADKKGAFRDPDQIRNHILAHFISLFAQPKRLRIDLVDEGVTTNLSDFFFDSIVSDRSPVAVDIGDGRMASMQHLLIPQKLAPIANSIVYCAADRAVRTEPIKDVIGMKSLPDETFGELIYIGLVSGDVFEESLNHERTGFDSPRGT